MDLIQGSSDWIDFRKKGIGSSDAPIVLGVSPYKTPMQLYQEKLGLVKSEYKAIFAVGHEWEPKIKKMVEEKEKIEFQPRVFVKPNKDHLRASLDGYNSEKHLVLEIKYANAEDHALALENKIPEKYYAQVQHQLNVVDGNLAIYGSYNEMSDSLAIVKVERNNDFIKLLEKKCDEFWHMVQTKTPPELTDRDYIDVASPTLEMFIGDYKKTLKKYKQLEVELNILKTKIIEDLPHTAVRAYGFKIHQVTRKGNIQYAKIPELKQIDLEQYRSEPSVYWTIKEGNNEGNIS